MQTVNRYDSAGFAFGENIVPTPQGGLRIPGRFSRTGVFDYRRPDGSIQREYRPPEEVFDPESIHSLFEAPITVGHPPGGYVTPINYTSVTKGQTSSDIVPEDQKFLSGSALIQDGDTLQKVLSRDLGEFSPGYGSVLDPTPGTTPDGEPYDVVQRKIRYHHVALLPPGSGRQGSDVALRLDDNGQQIFETQNKDKTMEFTPEQTKQLTDLLAMLPALQALVAAPPAPAVCPPVLDAQQSPAPLATPVPAAPLPDPKVENKIDQADIERMIAEGRDLGIKATKVLGEGYKFAGKTNRQVMTDVILHVDSKYETSGKSDDAVAAVFDVMLERFAERQSDLGKVRVAVNREDGDGELLDYKSDASKRLAAQIDKARNTAA